ncbi:hypothetical protein [Segeticoccus rhizosphaerae]|uniref:hypothetical protein n=1 Tax=Segeticoccus rhizosphaerae TaxID=1104777 RepID=UPI0010C0ADC0|nr:hypothetical protein [Ornithinicoccus soli]
MTYEDHLRKLSEGTAKTTAAVLASWREGLLDQGDFLDLTAGFIATGNAQGRALALLALRGYLEAATGTPEPVAIPAATDDRPRLSKALRTIVDADDDTTMRLHRLASNEPIQAATGAFNDGMAAHPRIEGWTRGLESGACQLCRWWWRDGRVWRADHAMPRHTGCVCHPIPTVTTTSNYQTARQAADRHRERTSA